MCNEWGVFQINALLVLLWGWELILGSMFRGATLCKHLRDFFFLEIGYPLGGKKKKKKEGRHFGK
jgi:hypothetical protein